MMWAGGAVAPDRMEPVSIPADELEDAFTVSSMRVCVAFARSQLAEMGVMGAAFVSPSQRMFTAFFRAQVNEADAHGIGRCLWVCQMARAIERLEADVATGVSPDRWARQLRAFVEKVDQALRRAGLGPTSLPLSELGGHQEPETA